MAKLSKKGFTAEDYQDLRDIFLEFNGTSTDNKRINAFLKNQIWFGKKPLSQIPQAVIGLIDRNSMDNKSDVTDKK